MPRYFYTARSITGELKSGNLEAKDIHELAQILRQQGYFLISADLEESKKRKMFKNFFTFPTIFKRVSLKEKIFFTRNLRVMINAGLPLPRSLKTLADQTRNKRLKKALEDIREKVTKGESLSQSFSYYPDIFSEIFRNMIIAGEESGTLENSLKVLTEQMEREQKLKSEILGAMVYPAVIICAMVGIGILMLIIVVPKLSETFSELNVELPFTTKMVIFLGNFLAQKWYFALLIIVGFIFFFRQILKTKLGKKTLDGLLLKVPVFSGLIRKSNSARMVRTLSSLILAGVPIIKALEITAKVISNTYFQKPVLEAVEKVRKGGKLFEALKPYQNLYFPLVIQMIEIGEETGETADILGKLADFYEEEVAIATKSLSSIIEPLLMILIGGAVGFFAISLIQPIYSMMGAIK